MSTEPIEIEDLQAALKTGRKPRDHGPYRVKVGDHDLKFTDAVIAAVNDYCEHCVFILWGSYAQKRGRFIDANKHLILTATHPSPLGANRGGFFGTKPFSKANDYLMAHGRAPIDWQLPQ